jgi:hypothetical protein
MVFAIFGTISIAGFKMVYAQESTTPSSSSTSTAHPPTADATLAAQLEAVEQSPTIPADSLPPRYPATFFSAKNPNWPPFPANLNSLPFWDLGDRTYLLEDFSVDYQAEAAAAAIANDVKPKVIESSGTDGVKPMLSSPNNLPVLAVARAGTNISITVTNGQAPENYELFSVPQLISYTWQAIAVGNTGQTNFLVPIENYPSPTAFFMVNWDTNTIPLWKAADPNNQATGVLNVWIDSPANGTTLN